MAQLLENCREVPQKLNRESPQDPASPLPGTPMLTAATECPWVGDGAHPHSGVPPANEEEGNPDTGDVDALENMPSERSQT